MVPTVTNGPKQPGQADHHHGDGDDADNALPITTVEALPVPSEARGNSLGVMLSLVGNGT